MDVTALPGPIVVTGGGGFIGSNLVHRLVTGGRDDVIAVDVEFPSWRTRALHGARRRSSQLAIEVEGAGTVFHLAADMGGVGYFHSDADLGAAMRNGYLTLTVLDAALAGDVGRLFFAASACAYPIERMHPRADPLEEVELGMGTPDALYGAEKLHGLRLCSKIPGARVGVLDTVYGPLQEHEGRRMKFPAAVATKAIRSARERVPLELWGDGAQRRSYCYIADAIDQILTVACADVYEGPVNIGAPGTVSCREIAEMCLDIVGADVPIVTNPAEPSGVLARECSRAKYERLYGPTPTRSHMAGFAEFIEWLQEVT